MSPRSASLRSRWMILGRNSRPRTVISLVLVCALATSSCSDVRRGLQGRGGTPSASDRASRVVDRLQQIADPTTRAVASVLTLNGMCSLSRIAGGQADGSVEQQIAPHFSKLKPEILTRVQRVRETLAEIPAITRASLLGKLGGHDPGDCSAAPMWDAIKTSLIYALGPPPRLRADFCSGNFDYADATSGARSITVSSRILQELGGELGPSIVAPEGSPVILGIEGDHVTARHPTLEATAAIGDKMSPYGVATSIPCNDPSACDPALGLVCGTRLSGNAVCFAFPVVQKDEELILRGYNFWDVEDARLVFTPVFPGEGTESTAVVASVDANEPTDGAAACPVANPANPTHNRAHFRIAANEGHFYKLRLYNHNGTFRTQRDGIDQASPRVLHVCYPPSQGTINVPLGTIRGCTRPVETCPQDGATCAATWTNLPRKLNDCRHLPGQPVVCGETPEWFVDQKLTTRTDGPPASPDDPIVYVIKDEPTYEFRATVAAIECKDETGQFNWPGEDEAMLSVVGLPMPPTPNVVQDLFNNLDQDKQAWHGDMDAGQRKQLGKLLWTLPGLKFDSQVFYIITLAEDDSKFLDFLAGAAVIVALAVIIYATGGAALWTIVGTAGALTIWGAIANSIGEDDLIGRASALATPLAMDERIAASHVPDFLVHPPTVTVLPPFPNIPSEKERAQPRLIHPFVNFPLSKPLQAECDPGTCPASKSCLVNRCVDAGFVDPTAGRGFKERREYVGSDGYYAVDLLWEKIKTGP
jgi:hypothetical protein